MYYKRIAQVERAFAAQPQAYQLTPRTITFGQQETLEVYECEPRVPTSAYFYPEEFEKQRIVLHFTAGQLRGDIATLTGQRGRVSVPFVIARDGKIYRLFSSKFWSYHLGPGALGGNTAQSQQTIGIELSNFGPLTRIEDQLYCWTNELYCNIQDFRQYQQLNAPYRGFSYFASFTDAQYESLAILLRYLTTFYQIPLTFLPAAQRYQHDQGILNFRGIVSHVNYRRDKSDIGPAFDWNRLISNSANPRSLIRSDLATITEEEMDRGKQFADPTPSSPILDGLGF